MANRYTGAEYVEWSGQTPLPPVAPPDTARIAYDTATGAVYISVNGGPYRPLVAGGYAPPVDTITVASASRLADVDAVDMLDGTVVFVRSVRDFFTLRRVSALTTDNITVIAAAGFVGGQWVREVIPDLVYLKQANWFIDGAAGDDENDGATALTALRTHAELARRWNYGTLIATTVSVNILADLVDTTPAVVGVEVPVSQNLFYIGVPVVDLAGTLTAATASNPATNVQQSVTDGTAPGWAAHVGKRIRLANNAMTGVLKAVSASEARTGYFMIPGANHQNGDVYTPVGNEAYSVERLPHFPSGILVSSGFEGSVVFVSVSYTKLDALRTAVFSFGCIQTGTELEGAMNPRTTACIFPSGSRFRVGNYDLIACCFIGDLVVDGNTLVTLPAATTGTPHCVVQGGSLRVGNYSFPVSGGDLRGYGIFDAPGDAVVLEPGGCLTLAGVVYGQGSAGYGIRAQRGGMQPYTAVGNKPTVTGALGDVFAFDVVYAYADVPFVSAWGGVLLRNGAAGTDPGERIQRGRAQLVNGTVVVGGGLRLYIVAASRIFVNPITAVGGGAVIGQMSVTARANGAGTGTFTVTSTTLASALVATDQREFDWEIVV